jgi:hypothetical protein
MKPKTVSQSSEGSQEISVHHTLLRASRVCRCVIFIHGLAAALCDAEMDSSMQVRRCHAIGVVGCGETMQRIFIKILAEVLESGETHGIRPR